MNGHGHVTPNSDGTKARCGGPALCFQCAKEQAQTRIQQESAEGEWVIVPKLPPEPVKTILGSQCGECGLRVRNGEAIGYCCPNRRCPMGLGSMVVS